MPQLACLVARSLPEAARQSTDIPQIGGLMTARWPDFACRSSVSCRRRRGREARGLLRSRSTLSASGSATSPPLRPAIQCSAGSSQIQLRRPHPGKTFYRGSFRDPSLKSDHRPLQPRPRPIADTWMEWPLTCPVPGNCTPGHILIRHSLPGTTILGGSNPKAGACNPRPGILGTTISIFVVSTTGPL